eukprot:TRINITY_DN4561_c0_g1_i3.p1 TRINITY_DN4561_c0_g1~~TRINITY_DN4561_c0_g1_i3.p1  ORF type:complete len:363 (+),score=92.90 TRINITY_DN4561_c0_g1_i3:124-1089(+)
MDDRSNEIGWEDIDPARYVVSSAVLWTLQDASVYPCDVVKARLQVQGAIPNTNFKYANTMDSFRQMIRQEGLRSFWKGFGTQTAGSVPTQVIYYGSYEFLTHHMNNTAKKFQYQSPSTDFAIDCTAGGIAELISACIWIPTDIVVQRLQIQGPRLPNQPPRYTGPIDAFQKILSQEGLPGLFRGSGPTLATFIPHGAIQFGVYQWTKKYIYYHDTGIIPKNAVASDDSYHRVNIIAGAVAGTAAAILTNPMDVAKTRIQTQDYTLGNPKYKGTIGTIKTIIAEEGAKALTKGLTARIMGGAPAAALGFGVYEVIKMFSMKT